MWLISSSSSSNSNKRTFQQVVQIKIILFSKQICRFTHTNNSSFNLHTYCLLYDRTNTRGKKICTASYSFSSCQSSCADYWGYCRNWNERPGKIKRKWLLIFIMTWIQDLHRIFFPFQNSVILGPLLIMPFVVFSGFFVHINDAPSYLQWLFHASFLKHGFESAMASMYG